MVRFFLTIEFRHWRGYISSYWSQIPELIKQEFELPFEIDYFEYDARRQWSWAHQETWKGSPFWREKQLVLSERWNANDLVRKYRLKQYNQCGCKIGIDINSLDYHKTLLDRFHSKTPNFFPELMHSANKKFISRGNERERVDFERESSVSVTLR